jgi:hypothetical protein
VVEITPQQISRSRAQNSSTALGLASRVYQQMTTPNSSSPTVDINSDGPAADDFGTNVGAVLEEQIHFVAEPEPGELQETGTRCNVGRTEQKVRLVAGTAMLAAAAFAPVSSGWKIGLAVLGAAELITGATRYCPVSQALGINTCQRSEL